MNKFNVYAHDKTDMESNLIYICACESKDTANYIVSALKQKDHSGELYDYYIKEI